ncbi:efp/ld130 fusion protein [Maruca vitrata nucleopolyhedrovirus]|uniref:Efp/ld130 fusion protein n=1 Tax=Maruca vitrata nucleopolyhedrovirus TaxID=1307954 RepID=A1YR76_9ABAC|nr:efp/ld130 fusion protein [Maruca vitrata nucleopolyhedrovirus]ABL75966.1 efp/ld130 fusion protein [Maruca vitrata nucleopolyhedrovirus]
MGGIKLIATYAIILSTTSLVVGRDRITFTPLEDSSGLLFERMYGLRHYTNDRFVFVKKFDFYPVLQELNNIKSKIELYASRFLTCKIAIKQNRSSIIKARIENRLQFLTQLNKDLVRYSVEESYNDVLENINLEYGDSAEFEVYDDYEHLSHWSNMTVSDAQALLQNPPKDRVMFLKTISAKNTNISEYINSTIECTDLANIMNVFNEKLNDASALAKMLKRIMKQTHKNKLDISNTVLDDGMLLTEMKKLVQTLHNHNRAWVVDFNKTMNDSFDLSQAYKLHLYLDLNTVIMFITMPLLKATSVSFNLYRVTTVPFCRGRMCLLIVSDNEYFGISDSKNYYVPVSDNFKQDCKKFTGYDEFLCPETELIATMNAKVCEIEMFMGRYSGDVINICDIRVANYNPKKAYVNTIMNNMKWLYIFPNSTTLVVHCNDASKFEMTVQPGVGVMLSTMSQTCAIRITHDGVTVTVDSRLYVGYSTTFWPKKIFNFNNYIDPFLLEKANTNFLPTIDDFNRSVLLQLSNKFRIKDYTSPPPQHFFRPSKIYTIDETSDEKDDNINIIVIMIAIVAALLLLCGLMIFLFCCIKKRCRQSNNIIVHYKNNNDFVKVEQPRVPQPLPLYPSLLEFNDYEPVVYPMIIEKIK